MLARLEDVDEEIKKNLEKIIGLEEVNAIQQEKAVYVESLANRVSAMDEHKQMVITIRTKSTFFKIHVMDNFSVPGGNTYDRPTW